MPLIEIVQDVIKLGNQSHPSLLYHILRRQQMVPFQLLPHSQQEFVQMCFLLVSGDVFRLEEVKVDQVTTIQTLHFPLLREDLRTRRRRNINRHKPGAQMPMKALLTRSALHSSSIRLTPVTFILIVGDQVLQRLGDVDPLVVGESIVAEVTHFDAFAVEVEWEADDGGTGRVFYERAC